MSFAEFSEISELATALTQKLDANIISIEDIAKLVENRKIAQLQSLFNEPEQAKQAWRIFYGYDDRGWKFNSNQQIVYKNHDKLVVKAEAGYSKTSGGIYHTVFVLGVSEAQVWIHRLPWVLTFEDEKFVWTEEFVKRQMHFNEDISEKTIFEKSKIVRVQGDLTITQTQTYQDYINEYVRNRKSDATEKFEKDFDNRVLDQFKDEINATYREHIDDIETLELISKKKSRNKKDRETVSQLKTKYGVEQNRVMATLLAEIEYGISQRIYHGGGLQQFAIDLIDRERAKQKYEKQLEKFLAEKVVYAEVEKYVKSKFKPLQVNLRQGNHLVIVEKANLKESWNDRVVVLDRTNLVCIHDEHMNSKAVLPPGVYELGLLRRHQSDQR